MSRNTSSRISFLDGLRGIAIILVVLFHAYSRWPRLYSYGDTFASFPLFAYGNLGVHLFFIISGFVILMTLDRCANFSIFILRRWLRLFPAMLVCSLIVYVTALWFPERPHGVVHLLDILPGLSFIAPSWWNYLFGSHIKDIEGAFWSLYVEVGFYVIFGILYYKYGWRNAVVALMGLHVLDRLYNIVPYYMPSTKLYGGFILDTIGAVYYVWFAAGCLYYRYYLDKSPKYLATAIILAMLGASYQGGGQWQPKLAALVVCVIFTMAIISDQVQKFLTHRALLFAGLISYPLYLIHENMMVATIVKLGRHIPSLFSIVIPILPITLVVVLGWFVTTVVEPRVKKMIKPAYTRFCHFIDEITAFSTHIRLHK